MRVIISPAKQMREDDALAPVSIPVLRGKASLVRDWLKDQSFEELQSLWKCSDKLAASAYELIRGLTLDRTGTPAVLAYDGIAFKYMAPGVFSYGEFDYVQEHLRILSGLYGVLRAMDGIEPYRLEMQQKATVAGCKGLYEFWGQSIYDEVMRDNGDRVVVNLASEEYAKCVRRFLQPGDTFVTCTFAQQSKGKLVSKGVYCKMARGEMVRYMAQNNVNEPEQLKGFDSPDWSYEPELSSDDDFVFLRSER